MELELRGRVALVTGGGRGIGSAIAERLSAEGCRVAVVDREPGAGEPAELVLQADVRDFERAAEVVAEVAARLGGVDILVCSAGIARDALSWKMTESQWDEVLAINLKGCFNYARAVVPQLRSRGGGRIVNIASINGLRGKPGQANYAASKAGVIGLSKTLARELGRYAVTVNVVAPGMVDTALTQRLSAEVREAAASESVLGRLTSADDVASLVAFLCSVRARSITGEVIRVDAGQYI